MDHHTLRARMAPELPAGLLAHVDRVVTLADELARHHGVNEAQTLLAAQGHDLPARAGAGRAASARGAARA